MSGWLLAIIVTVLGLAVSGYWFGVLRRQAAEREAGIQALAGLKWRECIGLVLEALHRDGYREAPASRQPGDGGTEYMMMRGDDKVLLSYKHGTAYRLGEANVRDFGNGVQLQGADHGVLVTLGTVEGMARDLARKMDVELVDGAALWPKVRGYVPASIRDTVRKQASEQTRKGLWTGVAVSFLLGIIALFAMPGADEPAGDATVAADSVPTADKRKAQVDPTLRQIQETAKAMAEVENLSADEKAARRAEAAKQIGAIPQVGSAAWSTQSTLLISVKETDGKDEALIEEGCRILTQYEELRFSRLQIEPPASSEVPVRWRQCQ
ncbi:restriction endonuclease [Arenimonas sp.]|uniref:restriction endonuclease n=1 Tax=Arenimonas sp. TaxID=1872635 RepID=UPI0039E5CF96